MSAQSNRKDFRRQRNSNRKSDQGRKIYPIGFHQLQDLITKEPIEILFTLKSKKSGFMELLSGETISKDKMAFVLTALGKACSCDERHAIHSVLQNVHSSSQFIFVHLQKYLCLLQTNECEYLHVTSLDYLVQFLQQLQRTLPAVASETLSIILPSLKYTVKKLGAHGQKIIPHLEAKIDELEEEKDKFFEVHTSQPNQKPIKEPLLNPPDDFRQISVLPSNRESIMDDNPFLRAAIKEGKYTDTEHYLDVQFRLLHEDIIRPLRDGVGEYLTALKKGNTNIKYKDVRLYSDVRVIKPNMSTSGLLHLVSFNVEPFKNICWENSKRLISGSLLCLSHNNFKSMLFATVIKRDVEELRRGLLEIQFERTEEIFDVEHKTTFVMIETNAYFEAYRHVLTALQQMTEETFPLKDYIIKCERNINPPRYLQGDTTFDFRPLMIPQSCLTDDDVITSPHLEHAKKIKVLHTDSWPSGHELSLDKSQLEALRAAVTKEFAVIQGPPGTGKTYIGLKIVQLLLHNCKVWNPSEQLSPIFVVCYTNHALDQFLEGILPITNSIVRIGGRSLNPAMHAYQLTSLRIQVRNKQGIKQHVYHNLMETKLQLKDIRGKVNAMEKSIEAASNSILTEKELQDFINTTHYGSLTSVKTTSLTDIFNSGNIILNWLDASNLNYDLENESLTDNLDKQANFSRNDKNAIVTNEEMADVEYITDQRIIESGDDDDDKMTVGDPLDGRTDWRTKGACKKQREFIKKKLQLVDIMTEDEEKHFKDVWSLNNADRWRLYRLWVARFVEFHIKQIISFQKIYNQNMGEFSEFRVQEDIDIMRHVKIVGMTTTGAAKYRNIVQKLQPQIVIVEEAAEVLEAHIVTSLTSFTEHLILIGDHQQLRPSPTVFELSIRYNLDISLFERMIKNGIESHRLSIQHRMHPCISQLLVPYIYKELKNHPSVTEYEDIKGVEKNLFFVCHDYYENSTDDSNSKSNNYEAIFLTHLCKYLILQGYKSSQITVLTMYAGQMFLLRRMMASTALTNKVHVTVVDNFQGQENDIILISFVRSNEEGNIGFLKVSNRVCVALSRAKKGLYCIGNFDLFVKSSNILWKNIVNELKCNQLIGYSLRLKCQNHPDMITEVITEKDFVRNVSEGGCNRLCCYRLNCGHTCTRKCHPYDQEHNEFKCMKQCQRKLCPKGHRCKKRCFEVCGQCTELVVEYIKPCNHRNKIPCYQNPDETKCRMNCDFTLLCGHCCTGKCGVPHPPCKVMVSSKSPCGHAVSVECHNSNDEWEKLKLCNEPCREELECGHLCTGKCSACKQKRLHIMCKEKCNRILVCGHQCNFPCAKNCPPCSRKCENSCQHSSCPRKCGEQCSLCQENCLWQCKHYKCKQVCGELCDRPPCNEPCSKLLKCKHPCIGLCEEPCPTLCKKCNKDEVTEIFFGNEDEDDAHFIKLQDCGHTFEVTGLTRWMEASVEHNKEIQMKCCPRCKKVIRKSLRYGNIIKTDLKNIEKVKEKVSGSAYQNSEKQKRLLNKVDEELYNEKQVIKNAVLKIASHTRNIADSAAMIDRIVSCMSNTLHKGGLHIQLLMTLENYMLFMDNIIKFSNNFLNVYDSIKLDSYDVWNFCLNTMCLILQFMDQKEISATSQQLEDITRELKRMSCFGKLFEILSKVPESFDNRNFKNSFANAVKLVTTLEPFNDSRSQLAEQSLNETIKYCSGSVLGILPAEKQSILKAMHLTQGHWYQCKNGHVYCITECGGAMEEGKCNECGAKIGGRSHTLLSDNRVATDMDGATHSAWSEAMNLGNFENLRL